MFNAFLWAGTAFLALALGFLIYRDLRYRAGGRQRHAVARVTGHREARNDDGDTIYFSRLTFTDHRGAAHEMSASFASRTAAPIGSEVAIRYPEQRPNLAREHDGGCANVFFYAVVIIMLAAFATAALLGFGEGIGG